MLNIPQTHRASSKLNHLTLAIADGMAVTAIYYVTVNSIHNGHFPEPYVVLLLLLLGTMAFFYDHFGVYYSHTSFTRHIFSLSKAWSSSFLFLLLLGFLTRETETFSRIALGIIFVTGLAAQGLIHMIFHLVLDWSKRPERTTRALIVGDDELARQIYHRIHDDPWIRQSIVGAVSLDTGPRDVVSDSEPRVLGSIEDTADLIDRHGIRIVYIAVPLNASPAIEPLYFQLLDRNVSVHWVPDIFSLPLINHGIGELNGLPILTLSETPLTGLNRLLKAVEDYVLASLILVLISPLMLLTAIAIKIDSPGPVFYRQPRTGWDGKVFRIWKFRSMYIQPPEVDAEVQQATRDDPRVTRVGRFIRRTSIDELPQLFNVLSGNMSLVGPRPHAVQHNQEYAGRITAYLARHRIKPGITGLAQVKGFRGETRDLELMTKRVEYDIEYINSWSLSLDLAIIAQTAFTLFSKHAY